MHGVHGVAGSNPVTPTILSPLEFSCLAVLTLILQGGFWLELADCLGIL